MKVPLVVIIIGIIAYGFLTASTVYYYNQSQEVTAKKSVNTNNFVGPVVQAQGSNQPNPITQYTQPSAPDGSLSYPANIYTIATGDTLATIATKLNLAQQYIANANSIIDPDSVEIGQQLVIPVLNTTTYYYRVNFIVDDNVAGQTVISQRSSPNSALTDPVKVAQSSASGYYNINTSSTFSLASEDLSKGQATVAVKEAGYTAMIGLIQPKTLGKDGFWAMVYIEEQDTSTSSSN